MSFQMLIPEASIFLPTRNESDMVVMTALARVIYKRRQDVGARE
jgi:hypothetical protein